MDRLRAILVGLPRRNKRLIQVATDITVVWAALWLAFIVRLGIDEMATPFRDHLWLFVAAPVVAIPLFIRFGMYRAVMRYFGNDALIAIFKAVTLSALILGLVVYWNSNQVHVVPRSIVFIYWWLSLIMVGGLRLAMRQYLATGFPHHSTCPLPAGKMACRVSLSMGRRGWQSTGRSTADGAFDAPCRFYR